MIPGKVWVGQNGEAAGKTFYPFTITLEDGTVGIANSTKNPPLYAVGDSVEYTIKGTDNRGNNKLGVKKLGGFTSQFQPGTTPATCGPQAASKPAFQSNGANIGARTGMAINCAVQWLKGGATDLSSEAGRLSFQRTAVFFLHLAEKLEGGIPEATKQEAQKPAPAPIPPAQQDPDDVPF